MSFLQVAIFNTSQDFLMFKWRRDNFCSWSLHLFGNISFHLTPGTPSLSGISLIPLSTYFKSLSPFLTLLCLQEFRVWRIHFSSCFLFSSLGDLIYSPGLNEWAKTYLHIDDFKMYIFCIQLFYIPSWISKRHTRLTYPKPNVLTCFSLIFPVSLKSITIYSIVHTKNLGRM